MRAVFFHTWTTVVDVSVVVALGVEQNADGGEREGENSVYGRQSLCWQSRRAVIRRAPCSHHPTLAIAFFFRIPSASESTCSADVQHNETQIQKEHVGKEIAGVI